MHAYICFSPLYARLWVTGNTYTLTDAESIMDVDLASKVWFCIK